MMTILLIVLVVAIIIGSFVPHGVEIPGFKGKSKQVHFFAYFLVSAIAAFAASTPKDLIYMLIAIILISGLIELVQYFISGRSASFTDFLVNILGVVVGGFASFSILYMSNALAEENYRLDVQTNAQWESIAERAINNPDVIGLYRLRKALCKQIEKGFISVEEATAIFEEERDRVVNSVHHEYA